MTGRRLLFYGVPILFCLAVHWLALKTWFSADDFAWLGLPLLDLHGFHDWLHVLFGPLAQGTIRTLSERVYFLVFTSLFGLDALPFRIWQFLTAFADIALIGSITGRITGSPLAGFAAALLWPANAALAIALDWCSAYNEVCCAFFFLLAFYLLLRYIDTGKRRYWIWQWAAFLAGFGALELIVTYPAIAALYTWLFARRHFRQTLWLFIPSALFTVFHFAYVPGPASPAYAMHFGPDILDMLGRYWAFGVAAARPETIDWRPAWLGFALAIAITAGGVTMLARRTRPTVFFCGWFILTLLPVLPLTAHFSEYYVTIPAIGLAMLGGFALVEFPAVAAPLVLLSAAAGIADIHFSDRFYYENARHMKKLITGLAATHANYAGKQVLLTGVDSDLFWTGFPHSPFRLIDMPRVYLAPGSEKKIEPHPEWGGTSRYRISLDDAVHALANGQAVAYAVDHEGHVRDATKTYEQVAESEYLSSHRDSLDAGDAVDASQLGPGWYGLENGSRWMGQTATLRMGGPSAPGERLAVTGYCPAAMLAKGPVELTVLADGKKLGTVSVSGPDQLFTADFALPPDVVGKYLIEVRLEVNRTIQIGSDARRLGMIFGTFRIK